MKENKIAIYIPSYNGASFLENVFIPDNCDCVVIDNNSSDNTLEVCTRRGFIFIGNNVTVPRTENWIRCIEHFRTSKYEWLKWLFIGDELTKNAGQIMTSAIKKYSSVGIILFDYNISLNKKIVLRTWKDHFDEGMVNSGDAQKESLEIGPYSTPLGYMISKNAKLEDLCIKDYSWAADVLLFQSLIENCDIAYVSKPIGDFIAQNRRTYSSARKACISYVDSLSAGYVNYTKYRTQFPNEQIKDTWFRQTMLSCLEDNCHSFSDLLKFQRSVWRAWVKMIMKKNNVRTNL